MRRVIAIGALAGAFLLVLAVPASAKKAPGMLFHDGEIVDTFVVPAPLPHGGIDPLYTFTNGVEGQLSVTAVAPGDGPYHGGKWAVSMVTFSPGVTPYLITSDAAVFAAQAAGDVTIVRTPEADNHCPVHK
jgi:hypothetical protein